MFKRDYGPTKLEYPLFANDTDSDAVDRFDTIVLRAGVIDTWATNWWPTTVTYLYDQWVADSQIAMGSLTHHGTWFHVYLNGIYWGIYLTEERAEARHAAAYFGGDNNDYDTIKRKSGRNGVEATDGNLYAFERLFEATMKGYTNNADYFAVQGMDANGLLDPSKERLADITNMIDYLLMIYYSGATDNCITWFHRNSSVNNMYCVYNRENPDGFKWFQHDCEHSFDTSQELDRTGPYDHANFRLA